MREIYGDLWELEADAKCITTNGFVKKDGRAVMGRGCALEARERYPNLDLRLGQLINTYGNNVFPLGYYLNEFNEPKKSSFELYSFPVKHHWKQKADINLIITSAKTLMNYVDREECTDVLLPRPGCGNGQLDWEDVKLVLEPILDERVAIVTW